MHYPELDCEWQETAPNALHLGILALDKYHRGEFPEDTQLDLLYLRKTQAEIEREAKKE
jgi:hypothetical protein